MNCRERKVIKVPTIQYAIDTGFPADKNANRLLEVAASGDNNVWMKGASTELKLLDIQGNLHHTTIINSYIGIFIICLYNKQLV